MVNYYRAALRRVSALAVTAAICLTSAAEAMDWIGLSSWAYQDVSAFVSKSLLPESLEGTQDFKRNITRGEFADVIVSVIKKTRSSYSYASYGFSVFEDTNANSGANFLGQMGLVNGMYEIKEKGVDQWGNRTTTKSYFVPDAEITRQDAAIILAGAANLYLSIASEGNSEITYADNGDIADYAYKSVTVVSEQGLMGDTGDDRFRPTDNITIEQAVTAAYRLFCKIPKIIYYDYASASRPLTDNYSNGVVKRNDGETITFSKGGETLLTLEADVYSSALYTANGQNLVYGVNFNDETDIFDLSNGSLIGTIPYIAVKADNYIYTASGRYAPVYYGLCDLNGTEILKPEYSVAEIEELIADNFKEPEQTPAPAEGKIYFSNSDDNDCLYMTDSNGDNETKLSSGGGAYSIEYYNGKVLYFCNGNLHIMDADGKNDRILGFMTVTNFGEEAKVWSPTEYSYDYDYITVKDSEQNKYVYLYDWDNEGTYRLDLTSDDAEPERLLDNNANIDFIYDGYIYYTTLSDDGNTVNTVYRTDGTNTETLIEGQGAIGGYGFYKNPTTDFSKLFFIKVRDDDEPTFHLLDIETKTITDLPGETETPTQTDAPIKLENFSDDTAEIYMIDSEDEMSVYSVYNGKKKSPFLCSVLDFRRGDKLFYRNADGAFMCYDVTNGDTDYIFDDSISVLRWGASTRIYSLDMTITSEVWTAAKLSDDFSDSFSSAIEDNSILSNRVLFSDANEILYSYSYAKNEKGLTVLFPCKGTDKYGKPVQFVHPDYRDWLCKLTENGKIYPVIKHKVQEAIYVPNEDVAYKGSNI